MKEEFNTVQAGHGGTAIAQHEILLKMKRAKNMLRRLSQRKATKNGRKRT